MSSSTALSALVAEEALDRARSLIERVGVSEAQRQSLLTCLAQLGGSLAAADMPACIYLPIMAYGAVRHDVQPAIPLASATVLLNAGRHLLDDVVDGQIESLDAGAHPGEALLHGTAYLSVLSQLALLELDVSLACRVRLQRTLLEGLIRMHAGQQSDLRLTGSEAPSPTAVEDSARGKTGETYAMYAALGAEMAEAFPWRVSRLGAMGLALGTAFQINSDCAELLVDGYSADLGAGTRTLPLALHMNRLSEGDRPAFFALLAEARVHIDAQTEVRAQLKRSGAIRACGILVETYRQRALRALDEAEPLEPAGSKLREMIGSVAMFPPKV